MYNYKYNGKELQETGMYDYGARFYMPDNGRWGTIDPRSQYTHETYSYVWNNPIYFNDPTGMTGEAWSDWIYNPKTERYKWDPNVTGPDNTPEGWDWVGPTGSYRIDGATVQLLEGGKTFTDIDEVAVSGVSPAAAAVVLSRNAQFGVFAFFAVAAWYISSDFVGSNQTHQGIRISPRMYRHTDNAESEATTDEDTDVNGITVPDEDKIPRDSLNPPTKPGNAPTFKKDGKSVEIHHEDQNANGPFKEMHPNDHRGKGNYNKNHPKGNKPLTKQERIRFNKARQQYWKKEYPNVK